MASQTETQNEIKVEEYRAQYGKVVSVEIDGELLVFRRPNKNEIIVLNKASRKDPGSAVEHAIQLCRVCHVGPGKTENQTGDVDRFANMYPLLFAGSDQQPGISDHLITLAHGEAKVVLT